MSLITTIYEKQQNDIGFSIFKFTLKYMLAVCIQRFFRHTITMEKVCFLT